MEARWLRALHPWHDGGAGVVDRRPFKAPGERAMSRRFLEPETRFFQRVLIGEKESPGNHSRFAPASLEEVELSSFDVRSFGAPSSPLD